MNKTEIKQIILEEIEAALEEMNMSPEMMAADSRPEEDDFAFDKMDGEMYDDGGDPLSENIQQYIDREDDISDIRGKKAGEDYKTIRIDFNKPMFGDLKNAVGSYARKKYGDNIELDWRDGQEVEIDINRDLNEMARTSNIFKLKDGAGLKDVLQFMQRVNDVLKTYKSPGQKRPKKRFTPEEMKALATAMLKPEGFTSKDIIAATSYTSPAQANKFLAALEQKGLITIISILKKSLVPDRDPNAPETRGRKAQSAEFDTADDPTGMDFSDFDNLDLSDPTALYEGEEDTITGEYEGKPVKFKIKDIEGIDDILNRSKGAKDFVNKLAMAVTDETSSLSKEDIKKVILFYKNQGKELKGESIDKEFHSTSVTSQHPNPDSLSAEEIEAYINANKKTLFGRSLRMYKMVLNNKKKELNENNNMSNNLTKHIRQQILEAKNPLAAKLKEVEAQGRIAALESKLAAIQELVEETNGRLTRIDEDSEFSEMMDKKAVKDVRKQLKELERAEAKIQKEYDKVSGGRKKETVVDEDYDEDPTISANEIADDSSLEDNLEENNDRFSGLSGVHDLKPMVTMNESTLRMQKLAGLITEGEYRKKRLNESPASNLELKRLAKLLFTKFKKSGARVKLGTDVGTIDQKGKVDGWDDISQALGDNDAIINYGIGNGKEGIHLSLVGDKANSLQGEIEDFINQGDVKLLKYPGDMPYKDSKGKMRKAQAYFIEPGKSMSERKF